MTTVNKSTSPISDLLPIHFPSRMKAERYYTTSSKNRWRVKMVKRSIRLSNRRPEWAIDQFDALNKDHPLYPLAKQVYAVTAKIVSQKNTRPENLQLSDPVDWAFFVKSKASFKTREKSHLDSNNSRLTRIVFYILLWLRYMFVCCCVTILLKILSFLNFLEKYVFFLLLRQLIELINFYFIHLTIQQKLKRYNTS